MSDQEEFRATECIQNINDPQEMFDKIDRDMKTQHDEMKCRECGETWDTEKEGDDCPSCGEAENIVKNQ